MTWKKNYSFLKRIIQRYDEIINFEIYLINFRDIQRALNCGYPKDMLHKLYERKGKCFTKLKQYQNADKAYKDALTKVGQANMIEEKKLAFAKGTEKLILQLRDLILQSKAVHKPGKY